MKNSKSSLFLMELIIVILFFSLSSAVCIQMFVKAHLLGKTTVDQSNSLLWCQNLTEIYSASIGDYYEDNDGLKSYMMNILSEDSLLTSDSIQTVLSPSLEATLSDSWEEIPFYIVLSFDDDWKACSADHAAYEVLFTYQGYDENENVYSSETAVYKKGNPSDDSSLYQNIYNLKVNKYIPERKG